MIFVNDKNTTKHINKLILQEEQGERAREEKEGREREK